MIESRKIKIKNVSFVRFFKPFDWMTRHYTVIDGYKCLLPDLVRVEKNKVGPEYYYLWNTPSGSLVTVSFDTIKKAKEFVLSNTYLETHGDGSSGLRIKHPENLKWDHVRQIDGVFEVDINRLCVDCYSAMPLLVS